MIHALMSAGYESNCYIVAGKKAAVIDSGCPAAILKAIDDLNIEIGYLINTHNHHDHLLGILELKERTCAKIAMHADDALALEAGDSKKILSPLFSAKTPKIEVEMKLSDGDVIDLDGLTLEVIHTPGHTPGGICLYEPETQSLFSGDTVFSDSIGRTDFPGGDTARMKESLEKLMRLHEERGVKTVYPGHGPLGDGDEIELIYERFFR